MRYDFAVIDTDSQIKLDLDADCRQLLTDINTGIIAVLSFYRAKLITKTVTGDLRTQVAALQMQCQKLSEHLLACEGDRRKLAGVQMGQFKLVQAIRQLVEQLVDDEAITTNKLTFSGLSLLDGSVI